MLDVIQTSKNIEYLRPGLDRKDLLSEGLEHAPGVQRDIIVGFSFQRFRSDDYQFGDSSTQSSAFFFVGLDRL